jgi:hypothetical protein
LSLIWLLKAAGNLEIQVKQLRDKSGISKVTEQRAASDLSQTFVAALT